MRSEFRLPALGADMEEGTLVEWHVAPGQTVRRGDVVAVVETDKGAIDVEIFRDGTVSELVVAPGTKVPVGTVLAYVDTAEGEASETAPDRGAASGTPAPSPSPATPLPAVSTGPAGRPHVSPAAAPDASGMRAAIAEAMSRSKREIPHYYLATTVDVTAALDWLESHNATVPPAERLLFAALVVKAVALACRELQGFSGFYREGRYEQSPAVHVGVAVAIRGGGLVAPAIMDTGDKSLAALMVDFRGLVARARAGRLRASELAAPTIIVTSLGEGSVDAVFPIIQPPQVAIVGAGTVVERPWVVAGAVVPRQVLTVSLAADHRVTDGRLGAQFLERIVSRLANPATL